MPEIPPPTGNQDPYTYPGYTPMPQPPRADGYQPYDPRYPRTPPLEGPPSTAMSIWALVLAILPGLCTWIVSVSLAIAVLNRSKDGRQHGKKNAIAALIIVPVWIVLIVTLVVIDEANDAERDTSGAITQSGDIVATDLQVGDCLPKDPGEGQEVFTVNVVPCGKLHLREVYATFDLEAGDYPGDDTVVRLAEGGCFARFEAFVGEPPADSALEVYYFYPQSSSWSLDRGVQCTISTGTTSTGTLKDSVSLSAGAEVLRLLGTVLR